MPQLIINTWSRRSITDDVKRELNWHKWSEWITTVLTCKLYTYMYIKWITCNSSELELMSWESNYCNLLILRIMINYLLSVWWIACYLYVCIYVCLLHSCTLEEGAEREPVGAEKRCYYFIYLQVTSNSALLVDCFKNLNTTEHHVSTLSSMGM